MNTTVILKSGIFDIQAVFDSQTKFILTLYDQEWSCSFSTFVNEDVVLSPPTVYDILCGTFVDDRFRSIQFVFPQIFNPSSKFLGCSLIMEDQMGSIKRRNFVFVPKYSPQIYCNPTTGPMKILAEPQSA